jgi:hypothetical protein
MADNAAATDSVLGLLLRLYWMMLGNGVLVVSAAFLIAYPQTPVVFLAAVYVLGVISLVAARFVDIRYCGGQTADGAAATLGDWTKYVKTLLPLSALLLGAVWALRHFLVK